MGFRSKVSEVALKEYKTVQAAIDAILAGKGELTYMHTCSIGNFAFHRQCLLPILSSYILIPKITSS